MTRAEAMVESYMRVKILQLTSSQVKANVVKPDKQLSGLGILIRNSSRDIVVVTIKRWYFNGIVFFAKVEAINLGYQTTKSVGLLPMVIEIDS